MYDPCRKIVKDLTLISSQRKGEGSNPDTAMSLYRYKLNKN